MRIDDLRGVRSDSRAGRAPAPVATSAWDLPQARSLPARADDSSRHRRALSARAQSSRSGGACRDERRVDASASARRPSACNCVAELIFRGPPPVAEANALGLRDGRFKRRNASRASPVSSASHAATVIAEIAAFGRIVRARRERIEHAARASANCHCCISRYGEHRRIVDESHLARPWPHAAAMPLADVL